MTPVTMARSTINGIAVKHGSNGGPDGLEDLRVELWWVSPELAADLLERNDRNRPLKYSGIHRYVRDIRDGRWMVNGESIKLDWDGNLMDGQNRLHACIEAEAGFWTLVVHGLDPDAFATLDTGVKRSFGDILSLLGEPNANILAAAIAEMWRYEQGMAGQTGMQGHANNDELLETFASHEGIRDSLWTCDGTRSLIPRPSQSVFCHYVFARRDPELADWFYRAMSSGAGLAADHALLHLRNRLMREHAELGTPDRRWQLAMTIKAWNAHRKNESVKVLRWSDREAFPDIE